MRSVCSLRRKEKQVRALKDVHCYDWKTLVEKGELNTLKVRELDKYIEHNKLSKNWKKIDKIKWITVHYYETSKESTFDTFPSSISVGEDSDESDSDNDLVLCDESESESESDDDSHTVACSRLRDSGEKSFSKKKFEKRAGAGERQASHTVTIQEVAAE